MTINKNQDQLIREKALNPKKSFIVQAPAGSGKTELLTQRFLRLLTYVDSPEEIIAITFTRKAAAEMRDRITSALTFASDNPKPDENHKAITWQLAKGALKQDQQLKWYLKENPNRLRILTIDALSASICAQIPLLCGFGGKPSIIEDATLCYRNAARAVLSSRHHIAAIETLLLHLDNNIEQLESLLTEILASREQWLPHIIDHHQNPNQLKIDLENGLANIAKEKMQALTCLVDRELTDELISCTQFASQYLSQEDPENIITQCAHLTQIPGKELNDLPAWIGLANLLLTKNNTWRKSVDKRCGFPSEKQNKMIKLKFIDLLEKLRANEPLRIALSELLMCPPIQYSEQQWTITHALINLLPYLAAELQVVFMQQGCIDFIELTLGALRALGDASQPTDLALHLDYQIQHLLIDEFQDTSITQFRLIEQLLSGWQPNDGRSLFLVGDPMQSIYRFRNAEVGLFLRTQQQGIANISLEKLTLQTNFRSNANIVEWINSVFENIFPRNADVAMGAVPYSSADAAQTHSQKSVFHHPLLNANIIHEAQHIVEIIRRCQEDNPNTSIAILVRSRSQLIDIIPELRAAKINFNAIDIETLAHRIEIQDLLSLTRALLYLDDRVAWLAVLRAPWCGLTLNDLHTLTQHCAEKPIWSSLIDFHTIKNLSLDAKIRLKRIVPVLEKSLINPEDLPLSAWIQTTWLALGGPASLIALSEGDNVEAYFKLLEAIEDDFSFTLLENKLRQLYVDTSSHESSTLHIMTIHKAKGLEFDHVIIPTLHKTTSADKNQLLMWLDRPSLQGGSDLILAPIRAANEKTEGIYQYLRTVEKTKLDYEMARLLYVAATRSKSSLHLISSIENNESNSNHLQPPPKGSFLNLLWEPCSKEITDTAKTPSNTASATKIKTTHKLIRFTEDWRLPTLFEKSISTLKNPIISLNSTILQKQQSNLGIMIHEILEKIATEGIEHWNQNRIPHLKPHWQRRLQQLGTLPAYLEAHLNLAIQAINNTLADPKGQWILSQDHQAAESEYAVTGFSKDQPVKFIIDRTFIDKNNIRWIIDYKTAVPTKESLEEFLAEQQELHREQLHHYANLFKHEETNSLKLGLYFPLCLGWCEWEFS